MEKAFAPQVLCPVLWPSSPPKVLADESSNTIPEVIKVKNSVEKNSSEQEKVQTCLAVAGSLLMDVT